MSKENIKSSYLIILAVCIIVPLISLTALASDGITLYTTYTGLSVTPGETVDYEIEVINMTDEIQNFDFSLEGLPENWKSTITARGNNLKKLAVKPKTFEDENSEDIDLDIEVPLRVEKGNYDFNFVARTDSGLEAVLPLSITVTEKGIFETELEVDQPNMEGYSDSDFEYDLTLTNKTADTQNYALRSKAPRGWDIRFKVGTDYVTSVSVESNESENINVEVKPPQNVKADNYKIDVQAAAGDTSDSTTLEAVIKGKYNFNLSTPTGRLSKEITAGKEEDIELVLKNTGTLPLRDITLDASTPMDWNVEFDNEEITVLEPEEETTVIATVSASEKAIAGDYQLEMTAETSEVSDNVSFRMTVKTSTLWGWIGILIIALVIAGIFYLIKKYGRR